MSLDMKARKFADVPANEDCARLCLYEKEFECKSFDYCTMTRDPATVCRLHDTHLREYGDPAKLDAKNAEKCFHYSKKYLYDFKKTKNQRITGRQQFTVISAVSAEECARQCWEATFECQDFDFCFASGKQNMGVGTCTLYVRSDEPAKTIMSPVCSTYAYTGNPDLIQPKVYALSASLHSNAFIENTAAAAAIRRSDLLWAMVSWAFPAVLAFTATLSILSTGQADCDAKPKKPVKPKAIPNLLQNYRDGWKLTAELNNADEKLTTYMVEYYDTETKQGFLSFKQNGLDDLNLFYISDTSELFVYQKGSCKVMDVQNPPDPVKSLVLRWRNWRQNSTILGPSALFARAWLAQSKELYYQGPAEPIRGIKSMQWAACYPEDDEPTRVWFADAIWEMGYGTEKSLPLRITTGPHTIDIMMMQPYVNDDDDVLKVIRDDRDSILSVIGADWTAAKKNTGSSIANLQWIYDYANGHTYSYVDRSGTYGCKVDAQDNVRPVVKLPDKNEVNMMDTILPTYDVLKKASYLGIEDAIMDTSVNQRNLPIRVAMYAYVNKMTQPYFYFFANIHDITTEVRDLNKKLNVKNCYNEEDSDYTWVQLGFPGKKEENKVENPKKQIKIVLHSSKNKAEIQRLLFALG
ncbi:hypothetical protein HPB51_007290 [Rhipicephalus microplus]|uniref:Apple domain-containing protein n=1 Tax=Rhipicephalus microplus TaxID=6941 RepID=A0A9J6E8Q4_RHIMP|nr:hypothetical protein HPB51_007290 [Rhipicephalus microplus]